MLAILAGIDMEVSSSSSRENYVNKEHVQLMYIHSSYENNAGHWKTNADHCIECTRGSQGNSTLEHCSVIVILRVVKERVLQETAFTKSFDSAILLFFLGSQIFSLDLDDFIDPDLL